MTRKEGDDILEAVIQLKTVLEHGFGGVDLPSLKTSMDHRFDLVDERFKQTDERMARGFARLDDRITGIRDELRDEFRRELREAAGGLRVEIAGVREDVIREIRSLKER